MAWQELVAWERQRAKLAVLIERARNVPGAQRLELDLRRVERSMSAVDRELSGPRLPARLERGPTRARRPAHRPR